MDTSMFHIMLDYLWLPVYVIVSLFWICFAGLCMLVWVFVYTSSSSSWVFQDVYTSDLYTFICLCENIYVNNFTTPLARQREAFSWQCCVLMDVLVWKQKDRENGSFWWGIEVLVLAALSTRVWYGCLQDANDVRHFPPPHSVRSVLGTCFG